MAIAAKGLKDVEPAQFKRLHFEEPLLQVLSNFHLCFDGGLAGLLDKMGRFEHRALDGLTNIMAVSGNREHTRF